MKKYWRIIGIVGIGMALRLYQVAIIPPSASLDEVSIGWNAFSLLKTGRDEYGERFPLVLRAYDDYRPGMYAYLVAPFLSIIGLNAFAVRLPSVAMSIGVIIATYVFVQSIFPAKKNAGKGERLIAASVASALLAVSPWHIYISRLGHEANLGLTGGILGIVFFFFFLKRNSWYFLVLSCLFFVVGLYGYQSQKIIIPLFVGGLASIFWRELATRWQLVMGCVVLSFVLLIPLGQTMFTEQGFIRFQATSVFREQNSWKWYSQRQEEYVSARAQGKLFQRVWNNKAMSSVRLFVSQYLSHFSYSWLFSGGREEAHKVPFMGLLYVWELPLILLGIVGSYFLLEKKTFLFLGLWLLSSPIPAAITTQAPHAMRSYTFLPVWQIYAGIGFVVSMGVVRRPRAKRLCMGLLALLGLVSVGKLHRNYFQLFPTLQSQSFSFAISTMMPYVISKESEYEKIIVSYQLGGENFSYPSYMFYLFYRAYDPTEYLMQGGTRSGSFQASHVIGNYEFRPIQKGERNTRTLYISDYFPPNSGEKVQYITHYLDGSPGIMAYTYE